MKIDETYHVASSCCPHVVLGKNSFHPPIFFPQTNVYVLNISSIFIILANFQSQSSPHMFSIFTHIMSRSEPGSSMEGPGRIQPRGVLPIMAYKGRLRPKGVPFSGFRSV